MKKEINEYGLINELMQSVNSIVFNEGVRVDLKIDRSKDSETSILKVKIEWYKGLSFQNLWEDWMLIDLDKLENKTKDYRIDILETYINYTYSEIEKFRSEGLKIQEIKNSL